MRTCTLCDNPARARGWCYRHYDRWRKWGDPLRVDRGGPARSSHWETVRAMNRGGKNDTAIAQAIGHTRARVQHMRKKMGLPPAPGPEMKQCPICRGTGQVRRSRQIAQEGA